MKRIALIFCAVMVLLPAVAAGDASRIVETLNFDWRFHAGDAAGAERPGYDDSGWQVVTVPHDFQISQPWVAPEKGEKADNSDAASNVKSRLSSRGFKEMGIGWYRKTITPDASWKGRRVVLDFEGIMLVGDVYLNGQRVGGTDYGYVGFDIDVTKLLKYGQPNVIAVKANTQRPENSRWYTGGGLFRDVNLVVTDAQQYFTRHPLYITTPRVSEREATVKIEAELACYLKIKELSVGVVIKDAAGATVYETKKAIPFNRGQKINEHLIDSITLTAPKLWSCETPHLYTAEVTLLRPDGTVADRVSEHFGVRSIEYSPEFGFKLNGKKVILKGIANHHTLGALGAAAYPRAMEKRIQLLKEYGFNHVRTSHNPYSKSFLDLCDKYGMLVVDELYDKWLTQFAGGRTEWVNLWQHDVPEFIRRDRNHPSVVMWSLGNELQTYWNLPYADWGITPYRLQRELLHRYDKTRPVTVAMHPRGRSQQTDSLPAPLVHETDIASYNYRYMYFPGDGRRFPNMIFYQSEANTAMMGPNYYEMDLDKVVGLAYWGMIDYLGESNGWPAKGWANGVFDISLEPKPIAYFLRSIFRPEEPVVHIGIIDSDDNTVWNDVKVGTQRMSDHWNRKAGSKMSLYTYTNADEVELLVNGKSVGVKKNVREPKTRNKIKWDGVKYEAGSIEAIARTAGKIVARHRIETTTDAVCLKSEADNAAWRADGQDLQHIRVSAVDKKGRRVQGEHGLLTFSVDGPAEIVGVINGDITSEELTVGNTRRL
ncbi:MAG: glycoside hydrolase family 2 TIM barrel-domain containing protein, partial [Prevotella sp.]|nr:glycoside hydrolase family 2 TIM barrel-domain containing protein [Prevotella sp.]